MNLTQRRQRGHQPAADAPTGLHNYDLGAKPGTTQQLVPGLERDFAEQFAINDAAAGVMDSAGMLATTRPLGFRDRVDSLMAFEEGQTRIRRTLAELVSRIISTSIITGRDDDAREPGVGLPGWRRRLDQAREREVRAEHRLADAERSLVQRGGEPPASHDSRALARLLAAASWVAVMAVIVEAPLVRVAMELATASEDLWEPWAMSALVLFGSVGIPDAVAHGLRTVRWAGGGRWIWPLIVLGIGVWGTVVWGTATLRAQAAHVDTGDGTGATGFEWVGADASTGQTGLDVVGQNLFPVFLAMMTALSVLVFIRSFTTHAPEQLDYVRAARALDSARAVTVEAEAAATEIEARVALAEAEARAGDRAADEYVGTLPAFGGLLYCEYEAQLLRSVADPSFTDAVRALGSRLATERSGDGLPSHSPAGGVR